MDKTSVLEDLKRIQASLSAVIAEIESENGGGVSATITEIRKVAILEEVYRARGKVTVRQLSDFALKYGKTPGSCGGYFSGKSPSMTGNEDDKRIPESLLKTDWFTGEGRYLTEEGLRVVLDKRAEWGKDWLDRIPREIVKSEVNVLTVITF